MRILVAAAVLIACAAAPARAQPSREHVEALRHLRLGQDSMRLEQWESAEAEFHAAIRLEPTLEMAHYGLGQVYMATRRYPAAVHAFLDCRDAFGRVNARRAADDATRQRALDDQIQGLEDQAALLGSGRGNILAGGKFDIDRSIADLKADQRRSTAAPEVPAWISLALGSAYFRSGALADAEREYREALKADPKLGEAHNNLAVVCLQTGRYAEAEVEVAAAEKSGFRVNPQLKADIKHAMGRS